MIMTVFAIGMLVGLFIGYFRVFGCVIRYFEYEHYMTKEDAEKELMKCLTKYKYISKKHYK